MMSARRGNWNLYLQRLAQTGWFGVPNTSGFVNYRERESERESERGQVKRKAELDGQ